MHLAAWRFSRKMKVEIICCMFNEEFLAPYFLRHYAWADRITILLDTDSTDRTEEIIKRDPKVNIMPLNMPDGMDDSLKSKQVTGAYLGSLADWAIIADADEFIFMDKSDLDKIESRYGAARVALYNVYRHVTESDLDPSRPVREQRTHGHLDARYVKPSIARGSQALFWGPGHHAIHSEKGIEYCPDIFIGAHWANADLCFCVERRLKGRRDRQSAVNKAFGWSVQNQGITESDIISECKQHENDVRIWGASEN